MKVYFSLSIWNFSPLSRLLSVSIHEISILSVYHSIDTHDVGFPLIQIIKFLSDDISLCIMPSGY